MNFKKYGLKLQNLIGCFKEMNETDDEDACVLRQYKHLCPKKLMALKFVKLSLMPIHKNKIMEQKI